MELVGCKMSSRKLLKLNWTPESILTAWGLIPNFLDGRKNKEVFGIFLNELLIVGSSSIAGSRISTVVLIG